MRFTTQQFADYMGIEDRDNAYTLIRFLEAQGLITRDGAEEPSEKRRGKRQYMYKFPDSVLDNVRALVHNHINRD